MGGSIDQMDNTSYQNIGLTEQSHETELNTIRGRQTLGEISTYRSEATNLGF